MKKLIAGNNLGKILERPKFAAKYIAGKLKANIGYSAGNGYALNPGRVFLVLTGKCNLKCSMCPQDKHPDFRDAFTEDRDNNIAELKKIIDDVSSFKPIIMVSGGELFMHPSWREFLSYIKEKGMYCSIGSNGTLMKKHASFLVESGIDEISISIDGTEEVHDEIRGIPGSYRRSLDSIAAVNAEKERLGMDKPRINILFTITPGNYKLIEQVAKEMEQLQIETFRIGHLNFLSQSDFDAHMKITGQLFGIERDVSWAGFIAEESGIDAQYIADALERIKNMQNKNFKVTVFPKFSRDEIIRYYSKGSFQSDSFKNACLAPWDIGVIGPQGELVTCPNYVVGNLRNHSFSDLWNNDRARKFRKIIKEKKHLPACSRGCCFYYI